MTYKFTIPGRLPGQNDVVASNRANKYAGNKLKKEAEDIVRYEIRRQLHGLHIGCSVTILYKFFEPNKRRDVDNICGGATKVIHDSLVKEGVLVDDNQRFILNFTPNFYCDPENPRIEVEILTVERGAAFGE